MNKNTKRKCKNCGVRKNKSEMIINIMAFCSFKCLTTYTNTVKLNTSKIRFEKSKSETTVRRKVKTVSDLKKEAQAVFNKYVRLRDIKKGYGCISCNKPYDGDRYKWDAGHYISRRHNKTRYHLNNVHLQCVRCNRYGYGETVAYRQNLIQRIGLSNVEWLENNYQQTYSFTLDYLSRLKKIFNKKIRRLS